MPERKVAHQPLDDQGKATAEARSAANWFPGEKEDVQVEDLAGVSEQTHLQWGPLFSEPHTGNDVEFYVTGADYFRNVAGYIRGATQCVFIAGWQVNYDVELDGKLTLFDCLREAVDRGATVYVMPWMSPKAGVDTGDFETMLALFQLNAGNPKGRAYCLPSMQQSDQGSLGLFFSHHQKLVVVDNKHAFVGGIDLAYGRRDDGEFSLKHDGRTLNELYNSCIPTVHELSAVEQKDCLTRAELLAACAADGFIGWAATFATSPSDALASSKDRYGSASQYVKDKQAELGKWWDNSDLWTDFLAPVKREVAAAAQRVTRWAWDELPQDIQRPLKGLRDTASANASSAMAAVLAWLNNADLSRLPPSLLPEVAAIIQALNYSMLSILYARSDAMPKRYQRLMEKIKVVPKSGKVLDVEVQPRMPWHDVHCRIEGPSVFDLSQNFIRRWNASALSYERSFARYRDPYAKFVDPLLNRIGLQVVRTPKAPRIESAHLPQRSAKIGSSIVQVMRSASENLNRQEAAALGSKQLPRLQNNCLKAMLKAIQSSSKFIYIEGQFFQSAYGEDGPAAGPSGPMSALLNINKSPIYQKCIELLDIKGVPVRDIPARMRWDRVDEVKKLAQGEEFLKDLKEVMTNVTTIEALRILGKPQERLLNPIGKALANRIARAVYDGVPFHVYIVLPVHPEGMLNVLNIMTQTHLTMHSLVLGERSLVNEVRRAILAKRWHDEKKMPLEEAMVEVGRLPLQDLRHGVRDGWKQYLTLLNLRNWDMIGSQPVTEQIYVHSKLLIADDRVAVLGSANINDRSQLGNRDSELAVVITDENPVLAKIDGQHDFPVASKVHDLRVRLWRKLFGLNSKSRRATRLSGPAIPAAPAAPSTWQAIQTVADENSRNYDKSFAFIPRNQPGQNIQPAAPQGRKDDGPTACIWPTWSYVNAKEPAEGGRLKERMPFDELFWRKASVHDVANTYAPSLKSVDVTPAAPQSIQGFICALPTSWTANERNLTGFNLTILAENEMNRDDQRLAAVVDREEISS